MVVIQVLSFLVADTDSVHTCFVKVAHDNLHCFD